MNFFKAWGKNLVYPYLYMGRTVSRSFNNIKEQVLSAKSGVEKLRHEASQISALDDSEGTKGKLAFQEKFEAARWTDASLEKRRKTVVKSKWVCRFFAMLFGAMGITCFVAYPGFWGAIAGVALLFAMLLYVIRTFLSCLYIAQIEERNLMTAKHFFSRADIFFRILYK